MARDGVTGRLDLSERDALRLVKRSCGVTRWRARRPGAMGMGDATWDGMVWKEFL